MLSPKIMAGFLLVGACSFALGPAERAAAQPTSENATTAIWSNEPGALDTPDTWDCSRIYPEYRSFLDAGNAPEEWKHVGKTFYDVANQKPYTWLDWIDWANENFCGPALAKPELVIVGPGALIGAAVAGAGTGLITAANGSGPLSPG